MAQANQAMVRHIEEQIANCDRHLERYSKDLQQPNPKLNKRVVRGQIDTWLDARLRHMRKLAEHRVQEELASQT